MKNITDLREHAIETISRLRSKKIDICEAGTTSKLYENIISSLKMELEHRKMIGDDSPIAFLGSEKLIRGKVLKQISKK